MLIADCIPCQYGHHDQCQGVYEPAPKGMIGGAMCGCKGECVERERKRREKTVPAPSSSGGGADRPELAAVVPECQGRPERGGGAWDQYADHLESALYEARMAASGSDAAQEDAEVRESLARRVSQLYAETETLGFELRAARAQRDTRQARVRELEAQRNALALTLFEAMPSSGPVRRTLWAALVELMGREWLSAQCEAQHRMALADRLDPPTDRDGA